MIKNTMKIEHEYKLQKKIDHFELWSKPKAKDLREKYLSATLKFEVQEKKEQEKKIIVETPEVLQRRRELQAIKEEILHLTTKQTFTKEVANKNFDEKRRAELLHAKMILNDNVGKKTFHLDKNLSA